MYTIPKYSNRNSDRATITFYVGDRRSRNSDNISFTISKRVLIENAPEFYGKFKGTGRRVRNIDGPVYDVTEKPMLFETILHWIEHGSVMTRAYLAPFYLEGHLLELYGVTGESYELPGLSNAIIDSLHDLHTSGRTKLQMIDKVYSMTEPGDGLRRLYFSCLMTLGNEDFDATKMENALIFIDLFQLAKTAQAGTSIDSKEAYHDAEDCEQTSVEEGEH